MDRTPAGNPQGFRSERDWDPMRTFRRHSGGAAINEEDLS